jgi:hypothetical protein
MITIHHPGGPAKYDILTAFKNERDEMGFVLRRLDNRKSIGCLYKDGIVWLHYPGKIPDLAAKGDFVYRRKNYSVISAEMYDNLEFSDENWEHYYRIDRKQPTMFSDLFPGL